MGLKLSSVKNDIPEEGVWVESADWPGVRFKVRSIKAKDYQIQRELLIHKLSKALGRAPTSPEMEPGLGKLVARHLLRGWEGLDGPDDKPLEYTPDVALAQLTDPDMAALEEQVIHAASRVADKDLEFNADAAKN